MRLLLILLSCLLALAPTASAKKIVVKKGTAYPTIQSGVDAAFAGDKIVVKSGVYQENVLIPSTHAGLVLKANGQVTIEGRAAESLIIETAAGTERIELDSAFKLESEVEYEVSQPPPEASE